MRELHVDSELSDNSTLTLRDDDGTTYALPITDALRAAVAGTAPEPEESKEPSLPEPDPLYSNPLTLRPREIQDKIRGGMSPQELADDMQVALSRIDAYAHPVVLERQAVAEQAKQAHPERENGPAKLTLWEVLAAAFGTRGHSLADATWDAYKDGPTWILRLTWQTGLTENQAEWILHNHHSSSATAEARDAVAADLTDPDFQQPVRTVTPIGLGHRDEDDTEEPITEELDGDDFLQNPDPEQPTTRRRKSVTPHWEDVLLGVRANTKRPRS